MQHRQELLVLNRCRASACIPSPRTVFVLSAVAGKRFAFFVATSGCITLAGSATGYRSGIRHHSLQLCPRERGCDFTRRGLLCAWQALLAAATREAGRVRSAL